MKKTKYEIKQLIKEELLFLDPMEKIELYNEYAFVAFDHYIDVFIPMEKISNEGSFSKIYKQIDHDRFNPDDPYYRIEDSFNEPIISNTESEAVKYINKRYFDDILEYIMENKDALRNEKIEQILKQGWKK